MTKTRFAQIAFFLALGYWIYQFFRADLSLFGIHFRLMTYWGLSLAVAVHFLNWRGRAREARGRGREYSAPSRHHGFTTMAVVVNLLVVFLYWRLYFIDPKLVNGDGIPVWHQEYYLHLVGPCLLVIDGVWLARAFRQIWRGVATTIGICIIYTIWVEGVVRPLNTSPQGSVTTGLPYPFLNDMAFDERLIFYAQTMLTALMFYGICWLVGQGWKRYD